MQSYNSVIQPKTIRDYVYSSEAKHRDQFTLKNILDMDKQYQKRNFTSQNSQRLLRTAPRPQTMQVDRIKVKFIDENKKDKNKTEAKRKSFSNKQLFCRSNSIAAEARKTTSQDKMKMKKALGKINLLAEGNQMNLDEEQQIRTIFYFLECLTETDNHYQYAFAYMCQRLKTLVYANNKSQQGAKIKQIAELNKNQFLINFIYRSLGRTTHESICSQLVGICYELYKQIQKVSQESVQNIQHWEIIAREKQQTILKLKRQIKYYSEHPSQDLYPYIKKLERQKSENLQQIQILARLKDENQYKIQIFQNTNMLLSEQIQSLKTKIYEFQLAELSTANEVEKSSELKQFQKNIQTLQDMLQKAKLKMEGMKQQYDKVKEYNQKLVSQRSILAKRAAVGYGQLTPRPNIIEIFAKNRLVMGNYFPSEKEGKQKQTTEKMVEGMVQILRLVPKQQLKAHMKKKPKEKFQEKSITKQVLGQIQKTKQQIQITRISSDKVKQQYNRQMNERQNLEKTRNRK